MAIEEGPVCPVPLPHHERIVMGHGSGGKMSHDLVARLFMPHLGSPPLLAGNDAGEISIPQGARLAISTDFACGLAIVLSGWGYWQAGGVRYGERCFHVGGASSVPDRRFYPGGRGGI